MQPNPAPETWQPGKVIAGKWIIERRIAVGGFGAVYLARHENLNTKCAIKRLREEHNIEPAVVKAFMNEARAMAALSSCRYVVQVLDMDVSDDHFHYIRMEFIEGGSLEDELRSLPGRQMDVGSALTVTRQVLCALEAAHGLGIRHLDVKTRNIMLHRDRNESTAKLVDFGIAAHIAESRSVDLRGLGTPGYSPLEQIDGSKRRGELDGRADLYALGMTLYRMLLGRAPFEHSEDPVAWLNLIRGAAVPKPSEDRPDLKAWVGLDEFVLRLTQRERDRRFHTATEALSALSEIHTKKEAKPVEPVPARNRGQLSGPVLTMIVILAVVLVLILLLVFFTSQPAIP
jgi:serine/threonine protein kinase